MMACRVLFVLTNGSRVHCFNKSASPKGETFQQNMQFIKAANLEIRHCPNSQKLQRFLIAFDSLFWQNRAPFFGQTLNRALPRLKFTDIPAVCESKARSIN